MEGKQTKGKQKIEIKKVENEEDRLVKFSKRKSGINKKASQLVALCGTDVGVLLFSKAGKPIAFANPSFESIVNRFINENSTQRGSTSSLLEARRQQRLVELNEKYNSFADQLKVENNHKNTNKRFGKENNHNEGWWDITTKEMGYEKVKRMEATFSDLRKRLYNELKEKMNETISSSKA